MIMSENSPARTRSKGWSWMPLAAAVAMVLTPALIPTPARAAEVDMKTAASNFSDSCVDCHGESGKGDGKKAADLKKKPADYTNCAEMSKLTDDYLFNVIKNGGKSVGKSKDMADFGKAYDDEEIHGLVAYVRSFCKKRGSQAVPDGNRAQSAGLEAGEVIESEPRRQFLARLFWAATGIVSAGIAAPILSYL